MVCFTLDALWNFGLSLSIIINLVGKVAQDLGNIELIWWFKVCVFLFYRWYLRFLCKILFQIRIRRVWWKANDVNCGNLWPLCKFMDGWGTNEFLPRIFWFGGTPGLSFCHCWLGRFQGEFSWQGNFVLMDAKNGLGYMISWSGFLDFFWLVSCICDQCHNIKPRYRNK